MPSSDECDLTSGWVDVDDGGVPVQLEKRLGVITFFRSNEHQPNKQSGFCGEGFSQLSCKTLNRKCKIDKK
jgi:hypothetical protein